MEFKGAHKVDNGNFITRYDLDYETVDGKAKTYEMISRNPDIRTIEDLQSPHVDAVVLIMTDPTGEKILISHEFRLAVGSWVYNFPAGLIDPGETPEVAAKRELKEETGIVAESIEHLTTIATSAGFCDEHLHIYVATGLSQEETNRDDDEFMNIIWVPFDEALETCKQATMIDSKTIISLTLYALKR